VSQIHRFHLRLGYDVLMACFLVISVGGRTVPLLSQYCISSFFHTAGAPFKAPASFNVSLFNVNVGGGPLKKTHSKVVERWLYGTLTGTYCSPIFQHQCDFSSATWHRLLVCASKAPGGEQESPPPHVPLEGDWRG
jgi:hypothetical protein